MARCLNLFVPFLTGAMVFFLVMGSAPLDVTSLEWFSHPDPLQAWLGWAFFRDAPWTLPVGLNPAYGLDFGNTIAYTDSIPIFAIFFKALSPFLPATFQYLGLWLLLCLMLQAWLGWKLTALITPDPVLRFLGCALFSFSLTMLFSFTAHFPLAPHFLILAALYLCLENEKSAVSHSVKWAVLLGACAMIQAYILIICGLLWGADFARRSIRAPFRLKNAAAELAGVALFALFCFWQAGFLAISPGGQGGFGLYKMNMLGPVNSCGWSYLLGELPAIEGEHFAFLGAGYLLLCLWAFPPLLVRRDSVGRIIRKYWIFFVVVCLMALYSLSYKVNFGPYQFAFPISEGIKHFFENTRVSSRFFWPAYYLLIIASIYAICKSYDKKIAIVLLTLALAVQAADSYPGWGAIARMNNSWRDNVEKTLVSPFWKQAAQKYDRIRALNFINMNPGWETLGLYALNSGLGIDYVYLSRFDVKNYERRVRENAAALESGKLEPDSFYVATDEEFEKAKKLIKDKSALMKKIDGFNIIAPGWKKTDETDAESR